MSSPLPASEQDADRLMHAMQVMTGQSVLVSEAIARRHGLNPADLEALGIIHARPQTTAGDLAAATGLTTGAVTAMIDRLEKAAFLRRDTDSKDRRKVLLRLRPASARAIAKDYSGLDTEMRRLIGQHSAKDIQIISRFLMAAIDVATTQLASLQRHQRKADQGKPSGKKGNAA